MISNEHIKIAAGPEITKDDIRQKVWSYLENNGLAKFPFPPYHRIPNFEGAAAAGQEVAKLPEFAAANIVTVSPDKPQEEVRYLTLQSRKKLLVPTSRLKSGLFNLLENAGNDDAEKLKFKSQSGGLKQLSTPVGLDTKMTVDLIVFGSVAVSLTGRRIGKGEGFADLEYAMMRTIKSITEKTTIITTVHDCQVFDDLPVELFESCDVPVDIIVTPTKVFRVGSLLPRPQKIYWNILNFRKLQQIPILQVLREAEEREGLDVALLEDEGQSEGPNWPRPYRDRGGGQHFRGNRGGRGQGFEPWSETRHPRPSQGFYPTRQFSRGRGRGRGRATPQVREEGNGDEGEFSPAVLQVTISVNKKNKIVNRMVEATDQMDRQGSADLDEETRKEKKKATRIFVAKIPPNSRAEDLLKEMMEKKVEPGYVIWKGSYAFVDFNVPPDNCEVLLDKLSGLSIAGTPLVVELAKERTRYGAGYYRRNRDSPADHRLHHHTTRDDSEHHNPNHYKSSHGEETRGGQPLD